MGVDYVVWIVPKDRSFRPTADRVANLVNALRDSKWAPMPDAPQQNSAILEILPSQSIMKQLPRYSMKFEPDPFVPSWIEFHGQHELAFEWYIHDASSAGVRFPFVFVPGDYQYFSLMVVLGSDYFYERGNSLMPFEAGETICECSHELAYQTGWLPSVHSERIYYVCPDCSEKYDPSRLSCRMTDWWTKKESS